MDKAEIQSHIRHLRMKTKRMMRGIRFGEHSARSSSHDGLEFDTLREYQEGDDIRRMDWHSSARSSRLMVRAYKENKQSVVLLALDESDSMKAGSTAYLKEDLMREIAVILGCCVEQEGGMLGLLRMQHNAFDFLPCKSNKSHMHYLYETMLSAPPVTVSKSATDTSILQKIALPKDILIFLITDGTDDLCERFIKAYAKRAALVIVRIRDPYEVTGMLPCGLVVVDPETQLTCDLLTVQQRQQFACAVQKWYAMQDTMMRSWKVRCIDIVAGTPYLPILRDALQQGV